MRWTPKDALGHTELANTPAKRKRWALKANAALEHCKQSNQGDCENRAIQQANAVLAQSTTSTKKVTDGVYLVSPHGRLIWEGRKTIIVKSKQFDLEGTWFIVSKENTKGLAFGVAEVGPVASVQADKFDALFKQHRVTRKERCYDETTRAFTDEGLKYFHELKPGMKVLSLSDTAPHAAVWDTIKRVFVYDYEGPMLHFYCSRSADLMVTPHHRLFFLHKGYAPAYERLERTSYKLPVSSALVRGRHPPKYVKGYPAKPLMRLLGWYLAEGSYRTEWTQVRFSLNRDNEEEIGEVEGLLDALGFKHSIYRAKDQASANVSCYDKKLYRLVKEFGRTSHTKRIPSWVFSLHHHLMWELFLGYHKGDGSTHEWKGYLQGTRRSMSADTASSDLRLGLVELGIRLGFRVNTRMIEPATRATKNGMQVCASGSHRLYFSRCRRTIIRNCDMHTIPYDGIVWDVEVKKNSNLLVERNGRFAFSGNSKWWPDNKKLYLYPIKSFKAFDKPMMVVVPPGVQTIMRNVQFIDKKPDVEPGQDRERPQTEEGRPRQADDAENPEAEQKAVREEVNMPYTSMEAVNPAIRGIKPPVTLAQANLIAKWADAMEEEADDGPRSPWAVAIAQFKRLYQVQAGKWVKKKKDGEKAVSLDEQGHIIRNAFRAKFPYSSAMAPSVPTEIWVKEIWDEFVIVESGTNTYKVPYNSSANEVTFAPREEWRQVEQAWDEVGKKALWSTVRPEVKARGEDQGVDGPPQGDGGAETCACPKCGHKIKHERGTPCAKTKCPECGATMQGKPAGDTEDAKEIKPGDGGGKATDDKGGRRLQSGKLKLLGSLKEKFEALLADLKDLIGWASYDDRKPAALSALFKENTGFKALRAPDGKTWLLTWATNAFEDREQEVFTTKSIEDYVARHATDDTKGKYDFWHLPGTEFGTIMWQGTAGRFLVETGPFDDTEIGRKAEEFFLAHPDGHSEFAPEGWGTSHKYEYREEDRKDGVYDWFEKQLTTVLPLSAAANPYNPQLEVMTVDEKQYKALVGIWGEDIATQVVALGEQRTKELEEAGVAFKSAEGTKAEDFAAQLHTVAETVKDEALKEKLESIAAEVEKISESKAAEKSEDGETDEEKQDGKELARIVAEELQLGELSTAFKAFGEVISTLMEQNKALSMRLETLEQEDEVKLAEKAKQLPRYNWFRASDAAETVLSKDDALKSAQPKRSPSAVRNIAGKVVGGN